MRKLITAATALSLVAGCSTTRVSEIAAGAVPALQQPSAQVSVPATRVSTQESSSAGGIDGWMPVMFRNKPMVDGNNKQYFWHPPSLKRDGNQVTYLIAAVFNNSDGNQPRVSLGQMTANCQTRAFHAISGTVYNSSGMVITTVSNTPEEIAKPGSLDEVALINICNARQTMTQADWESIQLEQLTHARQLNAEMINAALRTVAAL
ncbi:MAG: hypothetical protein M3O33_00015 [Cyanobacteriota bacterium]|nr:hypothetical protein [Cyanobacteriota bacterium]